MGSTRELVLVGRAEAQVDLMSAWRSVCSTLLPKASAKVLLFSDMTKKKARKMQKKCNFPTFYRILRHFVFKKLDLNGGNTV